MDIVCTRCGEPWNVYSLTDDMTPEEASNLKAGRGCPCCIGKEVCLKDITCLECEGHFGDGFCEQDYFKPRANDARYIQRELAGILGDDIDGLASMMDDFGLI